MRIKSRLLKPLSRLFGRSRAAKQSEPSGASTPAETRSGITARQHYIAMQSLVIDASTGMLPDLVEESQATIIPPIVWHDGSGTPDLTSGRPRLSGGVRVGERNLRSSAHYEGAVELMSVELAPPTVPKAELSGRWLYLGLVVDHFGHFLFESLGRIWALDEPMIGVIDGIVFLMHPDLPEQFSSAQQDIIAKVTDLPIRVITEPTLVDHLIIPRQESLSGIGMLSTSRQAATLRKRFYRESERTDEIVYLSRAGITSYSTGRILGGEDLENRMRDSGVRVERPETLSLDEQIKMYQRAKVIVAEDGSALHMVAVAARPDVTVIVLVRRPWMALIFEAHLSLFLGSGARIILLDPPGVRLGLPDGRYWVWLSVDAPALQRELATIEPAFANSSWRPINKHLVERESHEISELFVGGRHRLEPILS